MTNRLFIIPLLAALTFAACTQPGGPTASPAATPAPLMVAVKEGNSDVVKALLSAGDVNVNVTDEGGNTPLIEAARFGHDDIARALIARGASLEKKNLRGDTALSLAVTNGHDEVVKVLKEAGAKQ